MGDMIKAKAIVLALLVPIFMGTTMPPATDTGGYRLLKLDGHHVKWGVGILGVGATVSYAFVTTPRRFENAHNCGELVPMAGLVARHGISQLALEEQTAAAFRVWEAAADIRFVLSEDPDRADILIGAQANPVGRAFANVEYQPEGIDGVKIIQQALVCLNPTQRWKVGFDGDFDVYDLRFTLIHEIGHAIGLDHPGPSGQVMSFRYEERYSELQPGDFNGAQRIYGVSAQSLADSETPQRDTNSLRALIPSE